jgi:hypothetical protein
MRESSRNIVKFFLKYNKAIRLPIQVFIDEVKLIEEL